MRVFRTLYAKIFGWFWLTLLVGASLVIAVTLLTGTQPLGRRWMRVSQDMYAHSAVDFYETEGADALRRYLAVLKHSSGMDAALLDASQHNVLAAAVPPNVAAAMHESVRRGHSAVRLGRVWTAATPVAYGSQHFLFVIEVHPLEGFADGTFAYPLLSRMLLAMAVAAIFCFLLTRHIVAPVQALKIGAQRLAAGDLSSRVLPAIAPRKDEIADTARAFDQMADRMQMLIQKRQALPAEISHELRSPLTRMSVSMELMRRGATDVAEQIEADLERMNVMIAQILLLTRLDMQPELTDPERVDLRTMLESIARDAAYEAQLEGKTVTVDVDQSCITRGDANLLRSCMENVVRNAIHHTDAKTVVAIVATVCILGHSSDHTSDYVSNHASDQASDRCRVVVTDHGPGIPEAAMASLFEPFFRVSAARDQDGKGSGLGLAISRRIAELHGGTIRAENLSTRRGLQVTLEFPVAPSSVARQERG